MKIQLTILLTILSFICNEKKNQIKSVVTKETIKKETAIEKIKTFDDTLNIDNSRHFFILNDTILDKEKIQSFVNLLLTKRDTFYLYESFRFYDYETDIGFYFEIMKKNKIHEEIALRDATEMLNDSNNISLYLTKIIEKTRELSFIKTKNKIEIVFFGCERYNRKNDSYCLVNSLLSISQNESNQDYQNCLYSLRINNTKFMVSIEYWRKQIANPLGLSIFYKNKNLDSYFISENYVKYLSLEQCK